MLPVRSIINYPRADGPILKSLTFEFSWPTDAALSLKSLPTTGLKYKHLKKGPSIKTCNQMITKLWSFFWSQHPRKREECS